MKYGLITPYFIPGMSSKRVNYGDGLIMSAVRRELGTPAIILSSRQCPPRELIKKINNQLRCLVIAGANQLGPDYSIFEGADEVLLEEISIPVIPFGVGRNHVGGVGELTASQKARIALAFRNAPIASWRCRNTRDLAGHLIGVASANNLYTGCPVHHSPYGEEVDFSMPGSVLVSVTDRGKFIDREVSLIERCISLFGRDAVAVVFQQSLTSKKESLAFLHNSELRQRKKLIEWIAAKNLQMELPQSVEECYGTYARYETHIGSRLHVHLSFRSMGKASLCFAVDNRAADYLESIGEPLGDPDFKPSQISRCRFIDDELGMRYQRFVSELRSLIAG